MNAQLENKQNDGSPNRVNPADADQSKNRELLAAIISDAAVLCNGTMCKLRTVSFQQDGWDITAAAYLDGFAQVRSAAEIEFPSLQYASTGDSLGGPVEHFEALLHALHMAQPVTYSSCERFIHTLHFSRNKESLSITVWLAKNSAPVLASALRILARPEPVSGIPTRLATTEVPECKGH